MRRFICLVLSFVCFSCLGPPPKPSDDIGVSIPFFCTYAGFLVLEGWITVPVEKVDQIEKFGIDIYEYTLDCESALYHQMKCGAGHGGSNNQDQDWESDGRDS